MAKNLKKIIQEVCEENNIKCTFLSQDWVVILEKDGNIRFISGYKFDLNLHCIGLLADDKSALYNILKYKNIPVIEHKIIYSPQNSEDYAVGLNTYEYVKDYFIKNNNHIVIKPNSGTCGEDVFDITNLNQIENVLNKLFTTNYSLSMCPFYQIKHEYRVIMLNGESKLVYKKNIPKVIGDGKRSIRELLIEFNPKFFANKLNDSKYDIILKNKETFEYSWKFNLSQGATAKEVDDNVLKEKIIKIAKDVSNKINIKFGSIDIIETSNNELYVLEINSGVMLDNYMNANEQNYMVAKKIYKEAIKSLFDL